MKFFIWLNGEPQPEIERAIIMLNKQKVCNMFTLSDQKPDVCNHFLIGNFRRSFLWRTKTFVHYDVKISRTGTEAMISKNGSVDFFFATKEEVDLLRQSILSRYI